MRNSTVVFLVAVAVVLLAGCSRANSAAPTTPQPKLRTAAIPAPAPEPVPAPAPEPVPAPKESTLGDWTMLDPNTTELPPGFVFGFVNPRLKAFITVGYVPSAAYPNALAHVTANSERMAELGVTIGKPEAIEGIDAAWVTTYEERDGFKVYGGFAAKTSIKSPGQTIYYVLMKAVEPTETSDQTAAIEEARKDLVIFARDTDLEIEPRDPAENEIEQNMYWY